ncbi:MAG: amidohydrolase family protein [Candidatus Pelethousia sp.]|nr:amidohydrolase family protein [Candidatus Pelethousia sp.]
MLLIKNANVYEHDQVEDILIGDDGRYLEIRPNISIESKDGLEVIDAKNMLAAPTFVNTHMHFDKAYTALAGREKNEETLESSIRIMHDIKRAYTVEDVKARSVRAIRECVMFGTTKLRTNVDIDNMCNLVALEGVLAAKEATKDICDLQVVAFPQEGIYCNEGTERLMIEAMEMGADIAGGMPAAEWLDELKYRHVDFVFGLAEKHGALIDMHIDQSKDMFDRTLEYTAWLTLQKGLGGRVTGGHCSSIAYQNQSHAAKVMKLIKEADVNICTNTQVLAIMGVDQEPRTRGLTRIREMVDMGINIATAQDTICDGFHLYGTGDPLDYGLVGAYAAQYNTPPMARVMFDMLTKRSARIFDPDAKYGIAVGNVADLNIIDAANVQEALRTRASRPYVIKAGKHIASFERKASLLV